MVQPGPGKCVTYHSSIDYHEVEVNRTSETKEEIVELNVAATQCGFSWSPFHASAINYKYVAPCAVVRYHPGIKSRHSYTVERLLNSLRLKLNCAEALDKPS